MMIQRFAVILVGSTSHAMRAENLLNRAGIDCKLIPVPRNLSSDCGLCLRIASGDAAKARGILEKAKVQVEAIHTL